MTIILVFLTMIALMLLYVPISVTVGLAMVVGLLIEAQFPLMTFVQRMHDGLNSFTLLAIPMFMLTGRIMALGGVTDDLIKLSKALVGFLRGGLGYVNIVASMFFAGITGSCSSDTASIGAILIPAMVKEGYDREFSVAVTCTSSVIGIIIPPSIPMVLYASIGNVSLPRLLFGGFVPGIIFAVSLMAVTFVFAKKRNYPVSILMKPKEIVLSIVKGIPALMTIVILLGGIMSGIFTPTEAASVAVLYALMLGMFYYREIKVKNLPQILMDVAISTGMITLLIATATCLGYLFATQNLPKTISALILSLSNNRYIVLMLINVVLLFIGMWMDLGAALIIFAPIFMPLAVALGIDPVHFGLIMVVNLGIGVVTPPVGGCLFLACAIGQISITKVIRTLLPFILSMIVALLIITYIPQTVLFVPDFLFGPAAK